MCWYCAELAAQDGPRVKNTATQQSGVEVVLKPVYARRDDPHVLIALSERAPEEKR